MRWLIALCLSISMMICCWEIPAVAQGVFAEGNDAQAPLDGAAAANETAAAADPVNGQPVRGYLGTKFNSDERGGARVLAVIPNGPAALAGLQVGDVIVEMNERPVQVQDDLAQLIMRGQAGDRVEIKYVRGNDTYTTTTTLVAIPPGTEVGQVKEQPRRTLLLGIKPSVVDATIQDRFQFDPGRRGVYVNAVHANTPAEQANIPADSVIYKINDTLVDDPADLRREVNRLGPGADAEVFLVLLRDGQVVTETRQIRLGGASGTSGWQPRTTGAGQDRESLLQQIDDLKFEVDKLRKENSILRNQLEQLQPQG